MISTCLTLTSRENNATLSSINLHFSADNRKCKFKWNSFFFIFRQNMKEKSLCVFMFCHILDTSGFYEPFY